MKKIVLILGTYLALTACRSSYDEARNKPEIGKSTQASPTEIKATEMPTGSGQSTGPVTPPTSTHPQGGTNSSVTQQGNTHGSGSTGPKPTEDPAYIQVKHDGSQEELKKYNCKGTAVITDSGMDRNKNGLLEEAEIQETRIDCTEVVPASR